MHDEIDNWKHAKDILNNHDFPSKQDAMRLLSGSDEFLEQAKKKDLTWLVANYKIKQEVHFKQQYTILPQMVKRNDAILEEEKKDVDVPEYLRATVYDEINLDEYFKETVAPQNTYAQTFIKPSRQFAD